MSPTISTTSPFVDTLEPFVLYGPKPPGARNAYTVRPSLTDPLTTVKITIGKGAKAKTYKVFKEFACYHSRYLRSAFNGPFLEGHTQTIVLDDIEDPELFGNVQCWMYSGRLWDQNDAILLTSGLCMVWMLADRLIMPKLQNFVMKELFNKRGPSQPLPLITWLYKAPMPDGPLKQLWVDRWTFEVKKPAIESAFGSRGSVEVHCQFLCDVSKAYEKYTSELKYAFAIGAKGRSERRELFLEDYLVPEN